MSGDCIWDEADAVTGFASACGLDLADWQERLLGGPFGPAPEPPEPGDGDLVPQLLAKKMTAHILVPEELLMDYGVIPDTREHKPLARRERFRRWRREKISDLRMSAAGRAYRLISGEDVPEPEW